MKPLRILAIYRHYWPDTTPYALILKSIVERQASRGADVTVYTGQPSYNAVKGGGQPWVETQNGVEVRRVAMLPEPRRWTWLRAVNACYFLLRSIAHAVLGRRYDVLLANAHPPVAIGVALRVIKRLTGAKYILHLQDLHPEASAAISTTGPGMLYHLAMSFEKQNCRRADQLVALSADMRDSLANRELSLDRLTLINNCPLADPSPLDTDLPDCITDDSAVRLLFAGNLGRFQGLKTLVEAAWRVDQSRDWRLIFMGVGAMREELRHAAGALAGEKVFFLDRQPVSVARAAMQCCDYGVVSLTPGVCNYAFPSKSITYLSEGLPVLAVIEPETELARTLMDHRLGLVAQGHDEQSVLELLSEAIDRRNEWNPSERRRISRTADKLYGVDSMLTAWDRVFDGMAPGSLAAPPRTATKAA